MTDFGFIRVSTGSQDAQSQRRDLKAASPGAVIVSPDGRSASASKGEQLDALDAVIARLRKGDRVLVTDSSRLDRRDNLTSQVETMLAIRKTGATIVSLAPGEETFANGDDLGSWVTTLVKQNTNAEKSKTVKAQTHRGVMVIRDNKAHHGPLPVFWAATGERYRKQARCVDPDAVRDIYQRVAAGESLSSVARSYKTAKGDVMYPTSIRTLIAFKANYTGVEECSHTFQEVREEWHHKVVPVVDSALWHRANKRLEANKTKDRANRGGRPVAQASNWLSGLLSCPECGGTLYVNTSRTPAGNPRTPRLRCGGLARARKSCKRYLGVDVALVVGELDRFFTSEDLPVLKYDLVTGNAHELAELESALGRVQASLSALEDDDELEAALAERRRLRAAIEAFTVIPDTFAYTPTGQTIAEMWAESDASKRRIVKAVKDTLGLDITPEWGVDEDNLHLGVIPAELRKDDGIVDLGGGVCFRLPYSATNVP